jgi:hypothetical protein
VAFKSRERCDRWHDFRAGYPPDMEISVAWKLNLAYPTDVLILYDFFLVRYINSVAVFYEGNQRILSHKDTYYRTMAIM